VRDFGIYFKSPNNELKGICDLRDKRFLMCSATFSDLEAAIVKKVLGVPGGQWKVYQTAKEFQTGQKLPITFNKTVPRNEAEFAVEMTNCIQNAKKAPILVFLENYEGPERTKVAQIAALMKLEVRELPDDKTLSLVMNEATECASGVFIMPARFGRGVDFKL